MSLVALALAVALKMLGPAAGRAPLDCAYAPRAGGELSIFHRCAGKDAAGRIHFSRRRLRSMAYDGRGLASVFVGGWRYVARDGRSAPVMTWDNGPDPFASGLARSPDGGKVGYIDPRLRIVIAARFDGAYPFENGRAVVCIGCRIVSEGEHSSYVEGRWGCIDRRGRLVVALRPAGGHVACSRPAN